LRHDAGGGEGDGGEEREVEMHIEGLVGFVALVLRMTLMLD
jgi:hypothetical protein